ncbi:MAG: beta-propeller fold lactonase family protein [Chloroflexota bacterium]|nr:beta-propeller fold lactonase family protein [Chloroflexota bacterium]
MPDVNRFVYIPLTEERRFLVFAMDAGSGKLILKHDLDLSAQPWQLCISPDRRFLYQQVRDDGYSGVLTFRIDPETSDVAQIGDVELESDACYVSTDKTGRYLFAAYLFPGMVTVHRIDSDGVARGPAVDRQLTDLYAHYITTDNSNRFALVPHVTPTDAIYRFCFDETSGKLTPCDPPKVDTPTGHGPRHLAYHPTLDIVYANAEQASHVTVYRLDPDNGALEPMQSLSTEGFNGVNSTATVRVHPSGKAVYVSNRGHDSIAAFTVDQSTGLLTLAGHSSTKECPRTFGLDPDGHYLYAGSDHSGRVTSHGIDSNGLLHSLDIYELGMWPSWVLPVKLP